MLLSVSRLFFSFFKLSPCSIQLQGKKKKKSVFFFLFQSQTYFAQAPDFILVHSYNFFFPFIFFLQNHDMLVLFPSFLSSGTVFPLCGSPWISAAFLHCTIQQQSPRGRERNALKRLGTDTEQARLDAF